jgi:outer membrane protein assembly complex protein YaeT
MPGAPRNFAVLLVSLVTIAGCHKQFRLETPVPAQRVVIDELAIEGVSAIDEADLSEALETRESSSLPWGEKTYFDRDVFNADLDRIVALYADRGYPNARVVESDIRPDKDGDSVALRIVVDEGQPVRVGRLQYRGFDVLGSDTLEQLRAQATLQPGDVLARADVLRTVQLFANALRNEGYARANVEVEQGTPSADQTVDVTLRATPGMQAYFGAIEVVGNKTVSDDVVRRQLLYRPGERFTASTLEESQRRLYGLGLFEFATIDVVDGDTRQAEVKTHVTVSGRDHREVQFSLGYGTEEQLSGEAWLTHLNLFGGARKASVHGKWSWLDRGAELTFVQPYLFTPGLSFEARGNAWYADQRAYRVLSRGGRAGVIYAAGRYNVASATYVHELESSRISNEALTDPELRDDLIALGLNPTTGVQDGTLSALVFEAARNTTGSTLNPTRGYMGSLRFEQAGGWLPGSFNYYNTLGEARYYRTLAGVTFAERVQYGSIQPMGSPSDVPFFKRYFLGGAENLRGWGRYEVSPVSGSGLPIGGHALFVATSEVRFPVVGDFGGVAFVDAGNVWDAAWDFRPADLRYDTGIGLRYASPVGPLRLDWAYQLTPIEGLRIDGELQRRRWRVHFSIGQAF